MRMSVHRSGAARGGASHPIVELTLARVREFFREPEAIFWAFVFPLVLTLALAAAFPSAADRPVAVGLLPGPHTDGVRRALAASPALRVIELSAQEERRALREGTVHIVVVASEPPAYRYDPSQDDSHRARLAVDDALKRAAGRVDPWRASEERVLVPGSRYVDWLIPGLVGMGIMTNGLWAVAFPIVNARLRKLLKRLMASPMQRWEYLLAQMLGRLIFLAPEATLPLAFGHLAIGLPINGSYTAIALVVLVGALSFAAIGLLLGSRARTIEAVSGLVNAFQLPMWLLSGVFFSSANFPDVLQPVIHALPLTALNDALRAVVLDGGGVSQVWRELALVSAWGAAAFAIALRLFRWR
jgi:ABC-type multidrug transport system permease subunit